MVKRTIVTLLTAILCFSLCSCGKENAKQSQGSTKTAETAQESDKSQEVTDTEVTATTEAATNETAFTDVSMGETISLDYVEMSLERLEVADRYDFSYTEDTSVGTSTNSVSLEPSGDLMLVSLIGTFQNKTNKDYYTSNNGVFGKMIINGNEYNARFECYDTEQAESYLKVAAQQKTSYFLYAEVPQEVAENIEDCVVQFGFTQDFESKPIGKVEDLDSIYQLSAIPTKS